MFYFLINGEDSRHHHIVCTRRPDFPAPEPRYTDTQVPGRDGALTEFDGTYSDIAVDVEMNYITNPQNWHAAWREVKRYLLKGGIRELRFSDDLAFYYKCKKIVLGTNEREFRHTAAFTATFTLAPYEYLTDGKERYSYQVCAFNRYELCKPIYFITGEGMCTLTVNGNEMTANVGQNLTIDTDLQLAYRTDGTLQNTEVTGNFDELYLLPGENTISVTDGFDLKIQPNWRCL
jgi:predicted phage tail component-like protein